MEDAAHTVSVMRAIEARLLYGQADATEIWLARHGDCYVDMGPEPDPPLSSWGRDQAGRLADRARRAGLTASYSSNLRRAIETARALAEPAIDERLREFGNNALAAAEAAREGATVNFTEDPDAAQARIRDALDEIAGRHPGERVLVVAHGGIILAHLCDLLRVEFPKLRLL